MSAELDQKKLSEAKVMYSTLCSSLDNRKWTYSKDENELVVRTSAVGEDLSMKLFIKVDANRSVMYLKSPLPCKVDESNKCEMLVAVTAANWAMLNGMFEMDMADGYVGFKVVVPYMESLISEKLCKYLIDMSCRMIDIFNDKFVSVAEGRMTAEEFVGFAQNAI